MIIIVSYTKEKWDFVSISLLGMIICALIVGVSNSLTIENFIEFVEIEALILILSMQIITQIARESNIIEYFAIRMFRLSKGNQHFFLYTICLTGAFLAAIISDVIVAIILVPVIIRICNFLKIKAGTYLLALTIVINIGSLFTPFSSGENIIISQHFQLDTKFFITYYWGFSFIVLFLTIFLVDYFILRKEPKIEIARKELLLEILNPSIVITNKKLFYFNTLVFFGTIISFIFISQMYIIALISSMILVLVNNRHGEVPLKEVLKKINWEIIFFFIAMFIVIGCMREIGIFNIFQLQSLQNFNPIIVSIMMLLLVSFLSGLLANTPIMLIFLPIIDNLISNFNFPSIPLVFSLLVAVNLGGNILPQGAMCDVLTLKIAQENNVKNLTYKRLLKNGAIFALIHILISSIILIPLTILFPNGV